MTTSRSPVLNAPPPNSHPDNKMWVDEQIWGHRLWDAQSPWLIFLEFLTVAEACDREGKLLSNFQIDEDNRPSPLKFRPYKRMYLRNILYNNEEIFRIAERHTDDATAWRHWLQWMQDHAQAVSSIDFTYLRRRFRNFHQFASLVGMIRSSTIESGANKRWSSRFVFPFGRHAIYEDLNVSNGSSSREYIYFGLPGELLYQMLERSIHAKALGLHVSRLFENGDSCDRLLSLMQPDVPEDFQSRGNSYLPYAKHRVFDDLARDWLSLFELKLPRFDAYPHLATLASFHLLLYQLSVAAEVCGAQTPYFVCEVVAPRKTLVRELSSMSFLQNSQLSAKAVEQYVNRIGETDRWQRASSDPAGFASCREILRELVRWPRTDDDYDGPSDPAMLLRELRKAALARHRQHAGNVHRSYGGGAGLVSRRGTNKLRYAPTDELLKALILANVAVRMEYGEFLKLCYERYGLVFGEREAKRVLGAEEFDKRAFQANSDRLENRLKTLGMLRRLSDACAYVENPLRKVV